MWLMVFSICCVKHSSICIEIHQKYFSTNNVFNFYNEIYPFNGGVSQGANSFYYHADCDLTSGLILNDE